MDRVGFMMKKNRIEQFFEEHGPAVLFALGLAVWAALMIPWFLVHKRNFSDATVYYRMLQVYVLSMKDGIYPLWDPFNAWGRPEGLALRWIGEYHPFTALLIAFVKIGIPFVIGYGIYMLVFGISAMIAYYLVLKEVIEDKMAAVLTALFLCFSTFFYTMVFDPANIYLFWSVAVFFLFLIRFHRSFSLFDFWGLVFAVMIVMITYIPFYALTIFGVFFLGCILFYPERLANIFQGYRRFLARHWSWVLLGLFFVAASAVPGWRWYQMGADGTLVVGDWRHWGAPDQHMASLAYSAIASGGSIGPYFVQDMIRYLTGLNPSSLFVPLVAFWVIAMGTFVEINRRMVVAFFTGIIVLFLSMPAAVGLHKFLYDHIFIFRLFRNLQYFLWQSIPFFLVVVGLQLRRLLHLSEKKGLARLWWAVWALVVFCGSTMFFYRIRGIDAVTYGAAALCSIGLLLICRFPGKRMEAVLAVFLFMAVLLQSGYVFAHINKEIPDGARLVELEHQGPVLFQFQRPPRETDENFYGRSFAAFTDTSGFSGDLLSRHVVTRNAEVLEDADKDHLLAGYVKNKFYLYDRVEAAGKDRSSVELFMDALARGGGPAIVDDPEAAAGQQGSPVSGKRRALTEADMQVRQFDRNGIVFQMSVTERKFLVYTDCWFSGWQGLIDGKKVPVYRADAGFKGVWIPPGDHVIELRFGLRRLHRFHWMLFFMFNGLFLVLAGIGAKNFFDGKRMPYAV